MEWKRAAASTICILILSQGSISSAVAAASSNATPRMAVTHHVGRFGGQPVSYTSTVAETLLKDNDGAPTASVITIAYTRDNISDVDHRPVIFAFNGGPGASSSPLHTQALGPMRRSDTNLVGPAGSTLSANPYSPLDAVDLVFIDTVGTGFSRPVAGVDPKPFYSVTGDALEVAEVIREWLRANHRERSPRYLAGESYGTVRAAAIINSAKDLRFDGVLLIAVAATVAGNEMPYVSAFPTMAAGAWHFGKIDRAGRTVEQTFNQALDFARTDYVTALIRGGGLPLSEKHRVAARMSEFIGLPTELIERNDLRISKNDYMFNLLKDQGLRTGLLDVRVTAPLEPGQVGDIDDPALGVAPKRAQGASPGPPPSPEKIGALPSPTVGAYLTQDLKFPAEGAYIGVNFLVNSQWNYEGHANVFEALAAAMRADPTLRLFWAAGYYDLTTPAYAARYTLDQAGVPEAQLTSNYFPGPHGVYAGDENLKRFDGAVRDFVLKAPVP